MQVANFHTTCFSRNANSNFQNLFAVGYFLVLIYVMVMLGRFNSVQHRVWLSLAGILAVMLVRKK